MPLAQFEASEALFRSTIELGGLLLGSGAASLVVQQVLLPQGHKAMTASAVATILVRRARVGLLANRRRLGDAKDSGAVQAVSQHSPSVTLLLLPSPASFFLSLTCSLSLTLSDKLHLNVSLLFCLLTAGEA